MPDLSGWEILGGWIAAFLTLAIFSFLYKDNPVYKFAEHLFIGVSAGYAFILAITGTLRPNLYHHLIEGLETGAVWNFARLGGLVFGILLLLRLSPKTGWISRWPLALMIGVYAALRMTGLAQSDLVEQVKATMVPLHSNGLSLFGWEDSAFNNMVLIVGVLSVLIYFFFSVEQKTPLRQIGYVGTFFLMITFGSSFGFTVLGRISLLIGRAQDLYLFGERRYGYASIVTAILVVGLVAGWEVSGRSRRKSWSSQ
jgi:hypothetical protein